MKFFHFRTVTQHAGIFSIDLKTGASSITFIIQKALRAHNGSMRGAIATFATGFVFFGALLSPDAAFAREPEQHEAANCNDTRHTHYVARPQTDSMPVRKKEKMLIRRVLM